MNYEKIEQLNVNGLENIYIILSSNVRNFQMHSKPIINYYNSFKN